VLLEGLLGHGRRRLGKGRGELLAAVAVRAARANCLPRSRSALPGRREYPCRKNGVFTLALEAEFGRRSRNLPKSSSSPSLVFGGIFGFAMSRVTALDGRFSSGRSSFGSYSSLR